MASEKQGIPPFTGVDQIPGEAQYPGPQVPGFQPNYQQQQQQQQFAGPPAYGGVPIVVGQPGTTFSGRRAIIPGTPSRSGHLVLSVFATIFFLPLGIIGIIFALKAGNAYKSGNMLKGRTHARWSLCFSVTGLVIGLLLVVVVTPIVVSVSYYGYYNYNNYYYYYYDWDYWTTYRPSWKWESTTYWDECVYSDFKNFDCSDCELTYSYNSCMDCCRHYY